MIRKIIEIDENKCNGCGACAKACHEGAITIVDGKAKLIKDDYCDGLGDCLPSCPTDAIKIIEREAVAYDEVAVKAMQEKQNLPCGCPGTQSRIINRIKEKESINIEQKENQSMLKQWPIQIKLVPVSAPYFKNAKLLVAADCTAYAYANFHKEFIKDHITLIGCPKLDNIDYSEKITQIIKNNDIKSITIVRMEVPCCAGIENAVKKSLKASEKLIPWQVVTISTDGDILD